jgi:hypothetical protein
MATDKKKQQGASKKKTKAVLIIPPVPGEVPVVKIQKKIGIGLPVDEETFRKLKENAAKL